jgi:XTP/dITP diphosphohydrolase
MMKLVLASQNPHKIREISQILAHPRLQLLTLRDFALRADIKEDGESFRQNAYLKAQAVARLTGEIALADDSGLEVAALGGAPGVYSARYAGEGATDEENNQHLLKQMQGIPPGRRQARFRCVIAIVKPGGESFYAEGICEGLIAQRPKGKHGFGYDPLFIVPRYNKTMAELGPGVKNQISHRAQALIQARKIILPWCRQDKVPRK